MAGELSKVFQYSLDFYMGKILLVALFSIPFILAALVPFLVPAPTYLAAGALFVRTGSLPEFSLPDLIFTIIVYALIVFIISDTIVNVNIIVRSKRTLTDSTKEMVEAVPTQVMRVFFVLTIMLLLLFFAQLLTYDMKIQPLIYPLFAFIVSYLLFFVPPAIVIDHSTPSEAIARSVSLGLRQPILIIAWLVVAAFLLILSKMIGDLLFAGIFSQYFVLLLNSLIFLPFLIILQTQLYMEKYPLAR